ncbi:MAG TPA: cation-translocating P-type ATPase [Desulfocapsa sulfexigens]|nr:cation-translocating P-type ATPase [Desulfocapsa sulfexigens]
MPNISYTIKHRQPYRTRIRFYRLKRRKQLCTVVQERLLALSGITNVLVRDSSGSVILEHPDGEIALSIILDIVYGAESDHTITPESPSVSPAPPASCISCSSNNSTQNNHVPGRVLFFSGLYIFYLFAKRLFTTVVIPTTFIARVFTLPALVALGLSRPIQRQAIENFKQTGKADMGLISTGLLYISILIGDVLAALAVFWLFNLSSWLENRIKTRTRQAVREMLSGKVHNAWLVRDGAEIEVEVDSLELGDIISLRPGNTIPVDGTVTQGSSLVNESTLTGEGMPVIRQTGDPVLAGTVLEEGDILARVDRAGEETRLAAIIRLIETAETDPGELQLTSQRFSQAMVPVSLFLAASAFVFTGSLLQAMAVLIITCPCALRLSTSVAVSSAMSRAAIDGILIKGGRYIEIAGKVNVLVLDKTGTLTDMASEVATVTVLDKAFKSDTIIQLAASAQKTWPHPLSRAVTNKAEKLGLPLLACEETNLVVGQGVQARVKKSTNKKRILVGSRRFMETNQISCSHKVVQRRQEEISGASRLYVACNNSLIGLIETRSRVRGNVAQGVKQLRAMGVEHIVLLTGDHKSGANGLKERFGFDEVHWTQSPEDKASWIRNWKSRHPEDIVAMVGDGINDTPAFATADLSLAIGEGGADVTVEYADIVLQRGGIDQVATTLALGRKTLKTIKESYTIAISMNAGTLSMTTLGVISPVAGALLHNMITVAAVTNASKE